MSIVLPNGLNLAVTPIRFWQLTPPRLLVLHLWQKQRSEWQRRAAGGILMSALQKDNPQLVRHELEFISVAEPEHSFGRRFQRYDWYNLDRLEGEELRQFLDRFCDAWDSYRRLLPRKVRSRSAGPTLFDYSPAKRAGPMSENAHHSSYITPAQGSLFGAGPDRMQPPVRSYVPDPEKVRLRLMSLLERARSAETMPWSEHDARMWQTVFPNMCNWLPEDEARQLRLDFAQEMERLTRAA